jgi:peptidoglycan/LPS O-acetylase OafA/YrhL
VCLNITVIYLVGASRWAANWTGRVVALLGKYSLFGYISQIAILQFLRRVITANTLGSLRFAVSFVLAVVLTILSVMVLDAARKRSSPIDRSYKLIFS